MRKLRLAAAGIWLLAPWEAGCINLEKGFAPKRSFVLEADRSGERLAPAKGAFLKLRRFRVARLFEGKEFVYRRSDLDYESDFYNVFFLAPGIMISDEVGRWLSDSGRFEEVLASQSVKEPTHVLEGTITALFGDYRDAKNPRAVLGMQLAVLAGGADSPDVVLKKEYRREVPVADGAPESLARGWNQALRGLLEAFEGDLKGVELAVRR